MKWLRKLWVEQDTATNIMDGSIPASPPQVEYKITYTSTPDGLNQWKQWQWNNQWQQAQQKPWTGMNGNLPGLTPAVWQYQQLMDLLQLQHGYIPAQVGNPGVHTQEWADEQRRLFGIIEEHREAA